MPRSKQTIQAALDRFLLRVILEDPAEDFDNLRVVQVCDRAPQIGKAAAEGRRRGAVGLDEQLAVHAAGDIEGMTQAWRHDCRAVASPCPVAEHHPERAIDADMEDRSAVEPNTRLRWWRMDQLPSKTREDNLITHDYLSIAVEFDNGQDLTYYWSSELPVGTGFRCPIPTWTARETHVVARSGLEGLGQWFNEERDVYRDYGEKIGGALPVKIVRVWLLAVSLFQRTKGKCQYADISFVTDDGVMPVL